MRKEVKETELWRDYNYGRSYQTSVGLTTLVPECVRFLEGDQWVAPTEKTKNMPRPVINITKMVVRNKKSGILASKIKLNFRSERDAERSERLTAFNEIGRAHV